MIGFLADYEFVWGFQARVAGLSKTPPSFLYPPPTTFLGALAEAIAKDYGIPERRGRELMAKISENLLAIGFRPLNCFPVKYMDINRILAVRITGGVLYPSPSDPAKSFDSPARGKTILCSLNDDAPKIRWFLIFRDGFNFSGSKIEISEDHFWKVHRIGSKESVVSAVNVEKVEAKARSGIVYTNYSYPIEDGIKELEKNGRWEFEVYMNPYELSAESPVTLYLSGKKALPFRIPIMRTSFAPESRVEVSKLVAYEAGSEVVVGWRR